MNRLKKKLTFEQKRTASAKQRKRLNVSVKSRRPNVKMRRKCS
jgi:hypothetical protein